MIGKEYIYKMSGSTVECQWCGFPLGGATRITYLNDNQAICDLCLKKPAKTRKVDHGNKTVQPLNKTV